MKQFKKILYLFCKTCQPNTSSTVRYAFPFFLSALAILGAVTLATTGSTYIEVVPSQTNIKAGDNIALNVYVSAHKPVNAIDISLNVPRSQLRVTGIDTGESVITLWTKEPYVQGDYVILSGGTFRRGFLGRHLIATINAEATDTGLAYVNVSKSTLLAGDGSATEIKAAANSADEIKLFIASSDGSIPEGASSLEASVEVGIVTDIDGDGDVTFSDISRFMSAWSTRSAIFDFSGDGQMTFKDFAIILADSFFR